MDGFTSYGFADTLRLFTRGCVECPNISPSCPVCPAGQWCTQVPASCSTCSYRICKPSDDTGAVNTGSNSAKDDSVNVGAIVGGVVGGIVFIALVTFLIWRFCLKGRRQQQHDEWLEDEKEQDSPWLQQRAQSRSSVHTVGSLASTVMTRASNVIQIAFIPGIEGRGDEHAPPVPAIPMHVHSPYSPTTPTSPYHDNPHNSLQSSQQDHYFLPRGSTYSGFTDGSSLRYSTAQSIAPSLATRASMAPSISPSLVRQSVTSTVYHETESSASPVHTAFRGRANVVSVKPGSVNGPGGSTVPDMPSIDLSKYDQGETQTQHATSMPVVRVNGATVVRDRSEDNSVMSSPASKYGLVAKPQRVAAPQDNHIAAQIQAAARKASQQPEHTGLGGIKRDPSPFSDDNAIHSPKLD